MLRNYIIDNMLKVTIILFTLVIYLILDNVYLLSFIIVRQFLVNKLLPLIIDIMSPSLKLFICLLYSSSRDLNKEILKLLRKSNKVPTLL
jgi:uncharacterized protein (UPF0303 family)